jgi:hypothetical protein
MPGTIDRLEFEATSESAWNPHFRKLKARAAAPRGTAGRAAGARPDGFFAGGMKSVGMALELAVIA